MHEADVRTLLLRQWDLQPGSVSPLSGGMNSETWQVRLDADLWVLKVVDARQRRGFEAGLRAAGYVETAGIPAGAPVTTIGGALVADSSAGPSALLSWVTGTPLQGGDDDLPVIGETLGRVHDALARVDVSGAPGFDWVDPDAPHLDVAPWVRPAVRSALREWEAVRPRVHTWTFLHGDPAPEAFLVSPDRGVCGLVDWSSGCLGPCLYDLASAVMYVGAGAADRLVEAYLSHSPMHRAEVDLGLRPMLRLRWAVQADYFARRIVERDLTGLDDGTGNQKGLDDARRALLGRGLDNLDRPGRVSTSSSGREDDA